jgi:hypothetical protein
MSEELDRVDRITEAWFQEFREAGRKRQDARNRRSASKSDQDNQDRIRAISALGGSCSVCGNADSRVLQFHHSSGRRGPERGRIYKKIREAGPDPLGGFVLVCANCHAIAHASTGGSDQGDLDPPDNRG